MPVSLKLGYTLRFYPKYLKDGMESEKFRGTTDPSKLPGAQRKQYPYSMMNSTGMNSPWCYKLDILRHCKVLCVSTSVVKSNPKGIL